MRPYPVGSVSAVVTSDSAALDFQQRSAPSLDRGSRLNDRVAGASLLRLEDERVA
jgi:hypothetical protein